MSRTLIKFCLEGFLHQRRDHFRDITAEIGQIFYSRRLKERILGIGRHKEGLDPMVQTPVHKGELKLVGKVVEGADSTYDQEGVYLLGKVYYQLVPYRNMDIIIVGGELLHHIKALLHREHIFFLRIDRDYYLHLAEKLGGPVYYIEMPIGDRIEGSWENYFLHVVSYREYNIKKEIIQPSNKATPARWSCSLRARDTDRGAFCLVGAIYYNLCYRMRWVVRSRTASKL